MSGLGVFPLNAGWADMTPMAAKMKPARASRFRFLIDTWSLDATAVVTPPNFLQLTAPFSGRPSWSHIFFSVDDLIRSIRKRSGGIPSTVLEVDLTKIV
jgi:hypothetical protein